MMTRTIIILNGASSSGKTSIVKALQQTLDEPFLDAGLDRFLWMLPARYLERPLWDAVLGLATEAGETGHRLVLGMHRAIAELARAGNSVIADHVLIEPAWVADCAAVLADLSVWPVGVHCPLEVLEARELARRDRTLGQARAQHELVHRHVLYDVEVNTAEMTPGECAGYIRAAMESGTSTALKRLRPRLPESSRNRR
jgi:chloramphenicol 3-O phosphotransferase